MVKNTIKSHLFFIQREMKKNCDEILKEKLLNNNHITELIYLNDILNWIINIETKATNDECT